MSDLERAINIAGVGVGAQALRLRIISENMANARTVGVSPGADPYQRKTITFTDRPGRDLAHEFSLAPRIGVDRAPFAVEFDPGNPAADDRGQVLLPNVNLLVELADMREANRTFEANLQVAKQSSGLIGSIISLLRD